MIDKERLQLLVDEIREVVSLPLTSYACAKLLAFPFDAVRKAAAFYKQEGHTGFEKLYSLCCAATVSDGKKPQKERAQYVIEQLNLSFTDGEFMVVKKSVPKKSIPKEHEHLLQEKLAQSQKRLRAQAAPLDSDAARSRVYAFQKILNMVE